jgi:hypothetical protein
VVGGGGEDDGPDVVGGVVGGGGEHPQRLVVLLNLGNEPFTIDLPRASTLIAGDCDFTPSSGGLSATTPPHGWAILEP